MSTGPGPTYKEFSEVAYQEALDDNERLKSEVAALLSHAAADGKEPDLLLDAWREAEARADALAAEVDRLKGDLVKEYEQTKFWMGATAEQVHPLLARRIEELEANEAAYERIVGPKTYQEVADAIDALARRLAEAESAAAEAMREAIATVVKSWQHRLLLGPDTQTRLIDEIVSGVRRASPTGNAVKEGRSDD